MRHKLVSCIVVTHNRKEHVLACLKSLYKSSYPRYEVIVVDNASGDGTVESVRSAFPDTKIVASKKNSGLAGGRNEGQKQAAGDYLVFLDSDVVVDAEFLKEMVSLAQSDKKTGVIVPKIYFWDEPHLIWYAGARVNLLTSMVRHVGTGQADRGQYDDVGKTTHGPTAFFTTKDVIRRLGGHDEIFFMSYADTDFAFRAKAAGFSVLYNPRAKAWHKVSRIEAATTVRGLGLTAPWRAYYYARNRVIFMKRHAPALNFIIFLLIFNQVLLLCYSYRIIRAGGDSRSLKMYWSGWADGFKYLFGLPGRNLKRYYQ